MLLAVDIGNTAIKFGLFDGNTLTSKFSIPTRRNTGAGEIKLEVAERIRGAESAIVCSVVPGIDPAMKEFLRDATRTEAIFVDNTFDFGLKLNYEPLESLGTDRLVAAFAAVEKFGAPCIVCSLGTATTIDVVNEKREFLGGVIAPGMDAMAEALHAKASRLPQVEVEKTETVIGNSTTASIRSGLYHGYVAMVEGLITRIQTESGVHSVVATGGNATSLSSEFAGMTLEADLVLSGLQVIAHRMSGPRRL